jgi:plasmid stability protein
MVKWLKHRAARYNRTVEEEARYILTDAVKDDLTPEEWREKQLRFRDISDKMLEMTRGTKQTPSEILIREDRDRGHRP